MFNRKQNGSSFKTYVDGFGYKGYSFRISNFSLSNIPLNCVRMTTGMLSMSYVVAKNLFEVVNDNGKAHYLVYDDSGWRCPEEKFEAANKVIERTCPIVFPTQDKEKTYSMPFIGDAEWGHPIYSCPYGSWENVFSPFDPYSDSIFLFRHRDTLQSNQTFEGCLIKAIEETYKKADSECNAILSELRDKSNSETFKFLIEYGPYIGVGALLLLLGCKVYPCKRPQPLGFFLQKPEEHKLQHDYGSIPFSP